MKKIFGNLYIFSKLALTFTLFICLIGALYILYISYQKESKNNQIYSNYEEEELKNNINKNSDLINEIIKEIKINESVLLDIKKNIETLSAENETNKISNIVESVNSLNNNFNLLSEEIKNLKNNKLDSSLKKDQYNSNLVQESIDEIVDLILIKYENNINFNQEVDYLKKTIGEKKLANIEKILILSTKPYKGHTYLKKIFNEEVNIYLKKIIIENPDSFFSKIILPYIEVSPTSENQVNSDIILRIKETKLNIDNKNIENAFNNLKNIKGYENIFKLSSLEINKYLNFKNEILKLK